MKNNFDDSDIQLNSEFEHKIVLEEIENLLNAQQGTPEFKKLAFLIHLAVQYEEKYHKIEPPTKEEAIKFRLEQMNKKYSVK